jgi:hypothetical protein
MVKINLLSTLVYVIYIYRLLIGNFVHFIKGMDIILHLFNKLSIQIIICGDINIDYLAENCHKHQLDALLATYNLHSRVQFPTRNLNGSISAIETYLLIYLTMVNIPYTLL